LIVEEILEAMLAPPLRLAAQSKQSRDREGAPQGSRSKQSRNRKGASHETPLVEYGAMSQERPLDPSTSNGDGPVVTRLIGRIVTEPDEQTQAILRSQREDVRAAFFKAFQASLPGVDPAELYWRLEFVWGALGFILCNPRRLEVETGGMCDPADTGKVLSEMIAFFSAGFEALRGDLAKEAV